MLARISCLLILSLLVTSLVTVRANAEARPYEETIAEALAEYSRGNFAEARTLFALAHQQRPNARTYRGLGIVEYELRQYVLAVKHFQAALDASESPLTDKQREEVQELLERARRFVAHVRVETSPAGATLLIDGQPVTPDEDGYIAVNAGERELVASAPDHRDDELELLVRGGERRSVVLRLKPLSQAPSPAAAAAAQGAQGAPLEQATGSGVPTGAIVAWSVGAAGLATFAVSGALALDKDSELQECSPNCADSDADALDTYALVADIGLLVALVGGGVGTWIWLSDGSEESAEPAAQGAVRPWLAPGLTGVRADLRF